MSSYHRLSIKIDLDNHVVEATLRITGGCVDGIHADIDKELAHLPTCMLKIACHMSPVTLATCYSNRSYAYSLVEGCPHTVVATE